MADDFELKEKLRQAIANTYKRDEIEIIKKTFNGEDRFSLNKEMEGYIDDYQIVDESFFSEEADTDD